MGKVYSLIDYPVTREMLDTIFQKSCDDKQALWKEIENGEIGVYKMDGAWVAVSCCGANCCIEFFEGDGTGKRVATYKTLGILRRLVIACGCSICTMYVDGLKSWLVRRGGFKEIGKRGNQSLLMRVYNG